MKQILINALLFSISTLALACGGGGSGGSSGNEPSSVLEGDTRTSDTGIRLLHGAIDAAPIDLVSSARTEVLTTSRFSLEAGFIGISTDPQTITVLPGKSSGPVLYSANVTLSRNEHPTLLLYGSLETLGLTTKLIPDQRPQSLESNQAAIRVIHALNRAATLSLSVDGNPVDSSITFGSASDYRISTATSHSLVVARTVDGFPVYSGDVTLEGGKSYTLFVTGEIGQLVIARLLED